MSQVSIRTSKFPNIRTNKNVWLGSRDRIINRLQLHLLQCLVVTSYFQDVDGCPAEYCIPVYSTYELVSVKVSGAFYSGDLCMFLSSMNPLTYCFSISIA